MTPKLLLIRPVQVSDQSAWRRLFDGYAAFYQVPMSDEIAGNVWSWLHDPDHVLEGLVAEANGNLAGLAHYRCMPSPLRGCDAGFLDDLFVDPAARGQRIGESLLNELHKIGQARGWPFIRWITADDNYRARALYDRLARKTSWNLYDMALGQ